MKIDGNYSTGLRLKKVREFFRLTPREMAVQLKSSTSAYYKNESGVTIPRPNILLQLYKNFGISMDWFLFGTGPMMLNDEGHQTRERALKKELLDLKKEVEEQKKKNRQLAKKIDKKQDCIETRPEVRELLDFMGKEPLLYHEILVHFQRFKKEHVSGPND